MAATNLLSAFWFSFFVLYHCFFIPIYQLDSDYVICGLNSQTSSNLPLVFVNNFKFVVMSPWNVCPLRSKRLTTSGFFKTKLAVMKSSKHGFTSLCIPGHDPPIDITICMDVHPNPGPVLTLNTDLDPQRHSNSTSASSALSPLFSSPRGHLHGFPSSYYSSMNIIVGHNYFPLVNNFYLRTPTSSSGYVVLDSTVGNSNASSTVGLIPRSLPDLSYSRADLLNIRRHSKSHLSSSPSNFSSLLKDLNIFRFRSKRGGSRSSRRFQVSSNTKNSSYLATPADQNQKFCLLNSRSINNKSLQIKDYVVERDIDVLALTETWLKNNADCDFVIRDVCPSGYLLSHVPRKDRSGGGVGIMYKSNLKFRLCDSCTSFESFEFMELSLHSCSNIFRFVVVYRPPSTSSNQFLIDFSSLLERLITSPDNLLISGDFNLHVDDNNDKFGKRFLELLDCFNLRVLDCVTPTHRNNHALDLIITRPDEKLVSNHSVHDPVLSDHFAVHCTLSINKPPVQSRVLSYRKIRSINPDAFQRDIANSSLCLSPAADLSDLCLQYDSVLSSILNKHAPLRRKYFSVRPKAPWYNDEIKHNKTKRRTLERCWRKSKLTIDCELYVAQCNLVKKLIFEAKMKFYSKLIQEANSDSKALFRTVDKLLHRNPERKLPSASSSELLANNFVHFFKNKIINIKNKLSSLTPVDPDSFADLDSPPLQCHLDSFLPTSPEELSVTANKLLSKSCTLDPLPACLLRSHLGLLLPIICNTVNLSLDTGTVPSSLKIAVLKPLLKKPSLDHEVFGNYRPISNLKTVSKIIEKVVAVQLNNYLSDNNLHEPMQSAYKPFHSCETALLRVQNDILQAIDNRSCVALLLLDLSAAFDTVDHKILLKRLHSKFGIRGNALSWFRSYLSDRTQFASLDGASSETLQLDCGVPQSSVLGPILYLLYTSPVADLLRKHNMSFHLYADDTQLYIPFSCNDDFSLDQAMKLIENCATDIDNWMTLNKLKLNKDKTEFLILSSKHNPQRTFPVLHFGSDLITPSPKARNIGVTFDSTLSMVPHINNICKSSFYHLRNISRIRKYISVKTTETLVHAFISSKLDHCNSVLFGLPKNLIDKLQAVQNASARLITLTRKHDHITPVLIDLHWLPVADRIHFKIILLTFKALYGLVPTYIQELINKHKPSRNLRSSSHLALTPKSYNLKSYGQRSFTVAAPSLWNSLPSSIRDTTSLTLFKSQLKTYLFKLAFKL